MNLENPAGTRGGRSIALLDELRWEERRAAVSWVASIIGHMIGTPLNVIAGRAAMIRAEQGASAAATANVSRIEAQVEKLTHRLRQFIDYLSVPEPAAVTCSVHALVREAISAYELVARERGIVVALRPEKLPETTVERTSTLVALSGLLSLAIRAVDCGSTLELAVDQLGEARVAVALLVPGLVLPQLGFDRLEPPSELANDDPLVAERIQVLSLCSAIVRRHGGRLEVIPGTPVGSALRLECPTGRA
jgi:signal transduction histidine kinase